MATVNLVIVRHAEAVDGSLFGDDSQRPLTQRGQREANSLGRLRRIMALPLPDVVFTSGYERAEQTLERVLEGLTLSIVRDVQFSPEGSVRQAWEMVLKDAQSAENPRDRNRTIWIVGHNPNIERMLGLISVDVALVLKPFRKASLAWLKVKDIETSRPVAELIAYLPRPQDERERNSQPDL